MDSIPVFKLNAVKKSDLSKNTPVINRDEFEYYLWVRIPDDCLHMFNLFDIQELGEHVKPVCIMKSVKYFGGPWYRFDSSYLNLDPGYHIYRMHLVNKVSDDAVSIFFGYTIQDDSPKKPYIYIDPDEAGRCCCNVTSENRVS